MGKKRCRALDSVLTISDQPTKRERLYQDTVISFTDEDYPSELKPHERALDITAQVGSMDMKRIMIDNRSSIDIL